MILYFLRHAEAEEAGPGADDAARRLTSAGVASMRAAAPLWQSLNLRPEVVLTSPLARAEHTAMLFTEAIGLTGGAVTDERLCPGADWGAMARAMTDHPDARRVMFVGHEPDLSNVVELLTGAASVRMRKGGLACVEFYGIPEVGTGELAWLLDPDLYLSRNAEPAGG